LLRFKNAFGIQNDIRPCERFHIQTFYCHCLAGNKVSLFRFRKHQCFDWRSSHLEWVTCFLNRQKFWSIVHSTNSCQLSPAWLSTQTKSSFSSIILFLSNRYESPNQCLVKSMLLPPPKINFCCALFSCKIVSNRLQNDSNELFCFGFNAKSIVFLKRN
jgi:hypothetical protein